MKVTKCADCPLFNHDRDYCQHPDSTVEDICPEYGEPYDAEQLYFAGCPLKTKPITIELASE